MTHDEVLSLLFPGGHAVKPGPAGTIDGSGKVKTVGDVTVVGIVGGTPLSVDAAMHLAGCVLSTVREGGKRPIIIVVDTASQNMARRDELLGLNEFLAHLAKSVALASRQGHRTVSVLYGHAAAGAFIATCLASQTLVALTGAEPSVMALPSISRVTKLPMDQLMELAKTTPIFAPGVDPLYAIGAVRDKWAADKTLADRLAAILTQPEDEQDERDALGLQRKGRLMARKVAERVREEATGA
jgi:malonate decarboxylase gamma subunit